MRVIIDRIFYLGKAIFCYFLLFGVVHSYGVWPVYTEDCGGWRPDGGQSNVLGPVFESGYGERESWMALRPLAGRYVDHCIDEENNYLLYPLFHSQRSPTISNWNMLNVFKGRKEFSRSGELLSSRFTLFPLFERHYDGCTGRSRYSLFPIHGGVRNYFGQDFIRWIVFPLYLTIEKCGVVQHHFPWPIVRWTTGEGAGGFGVWPIFGRSYSEGRYDKRFVLWPLIYKEEVCVPDVGVERGHAFLPFYEYRCSPKREVKRFLWPFFSHIEENEPCYVETQWLWPLFVQGRGEEKYVNRWAPFYSRSIRKGVDRRWLMWPLLNIRQWEESGLWVKQERLLYFLFSRQTQVSCDMDCPFEAQKVSLWPLFTYWDNGCGRKQFQFPSLFEPLFPVNKGVKRMYNPLFSVFKASMNPEDGVARQSILWDLVAAEKGPEHQRFSIGPILDIESCCDGDKRFEVLKGLIGYRREGGVGKFRFLWLSF